MKLNMDSIDLFPNDFLLAFIKPLPMIALRSLPFSIFDANRSGYANRSTTGGRPKSGESARCRAPSPHHQPLTPSPSPRQPLSQNHPRSPANSSAARFLASCQAKSKPRAVGTRVGTLFAGWPASNGTIVANPKRPRGVAVASSRCAGWRSSNPSPCWLRLGTGEPRPHIRSCLRRSRRLRRGSVAAQERSGSYGFPRPSWCSTFGSGMLIRFISQSMSSHRSESVSEGVRSPP